MKEELEELANTRQIYNVEFVGYAPYGKMAAYLKQSDVLVNSFVKKAPQSIVTKIGDYLAAGKAMINTCMSPEFREKVEADGFGVNIMPEDEKSWQMPLKIFMRRKKSVWKWEEKPDRSQKNSLTVRRHIRELQS